MHIERSIPSRAVLSALLVVVCALSVVASAPRTYAAGVPIKINFQSATAPLPTGYFRDSGEGYDVRTAADQGGGLLSYGWVVPGTNTPLDRTSLGRDRNQNTIDQRLDTLVHMQANSTESAWEIALADGQYDVTVAVGDSQISTSSDSHTIRVEGVNVIDGFVVSGNNGTFTRHKTVAVQTTVSDGRLTIDALGGINTKINYIDIARIDPGDPERPRVTGVTPADGATDVARNSNVVVTVRVPNGGINANTVNANTVRLMRMSDGAIVPATINTSGGGDEISLTVNGYLDPSTRYRFDVTDEVKDASGLHFLPFSSIFTTGTSGGPGGNSSGIAFEQIKSVASGKLFSSLAIGPDGKLYAATLTGEIMRYTISSSAGLLSNAQTISTVKTAAGENRAIIGLAFDPAATASNLILWVAHNGPYVESNAPDWTGKISRLSGGNLTTIKDYVINLPHSYKDHMVNSLAFGPDGKLYVLVGSNTAMGAPDAAWGQRPERLLSGAVLQVNPSTIANPPLDVKTEDGGDYNPYASGAPVKLYASGVRNAFDLVWHSNGQLYVPTNGSAAGGNTPAIPEPLPASCAKRIDGDPYTGPSGVPGLTAVDKSQNDFLFRVVQHGYYGHPNPLRCEWIMNGGNPTSSADPAEVSQYPTGTLPDPNWRGVSYDFGAHMSPNGAIEYRSDTFNGKLKGKLLVARFSLEDDIIALTPDGTSKDIVAAQDGLSGLTGFNNPLDLVENRANGDLYVIEFGPPGVITLLRPLSDSIPQIELTPERIVTSDLKDNTAGTPETVTIRNTGNATLTISNISLVGPNANQFQIIDTQPALPMTVAAGSTGAVRVAMKATTLGPTGALLQISSNDPSMPLIELSLRGLGVLGTGAQEPSLQWILDTYEIPVNVGDDDPTTSVINSSTTQQRAALLGDEVSMQQFQRADTDNPVLIEPLAVFGPTDNNPVVRFGWYESGNAAAKTELFSVSNSPTSNGQRLNPVLNDNASLSFDPGLDSFGFYSSWPFFNDRTVFSEDALNTFNGAIPHHVRVYELKNSRGVVVPNAFIVAMEEHISGFDYQDVVVIVRNIKTATPGMNPPTADAGADQAVRVGTQVVLAGGGSDLDGDPLTYTWQQTGGPAVVLEGSGSIRTFTPTSPGTYIFTLVVTDPGGLSGTDNVAVIVTEGQPVEKQPTRLFLPIVSRN